MNSWDSDDHETGFTKKFSNLSKKPNTSGKIMVGISTIDIVLKFIILIGIFIIVGRTKVLINFETELNKSVQEKDIFFNKTYQLMDRISSDLDYYKQIIDNEKADVDDIKKDIKEIMLIIKNTTIAIQQLFHNCGECKYKYECEYKYNNNNTLIHDIDIIIDNTLQITNKLSELASNSNITTITKNFENFTTLINVLSRDSEIIDNIILKVIPFMKNMTGYQNKTLKFQSSVNTFINNISSFIKNDDIKKDISL